MLRGETGTPMRRIERANNSLALAEPEPLTLANLTTQSFTASIRLAMAVSLGGYDHMNSLVVHGELDRG
jgi:hypothetical protein